MDAIANYCYTGINPAKFLFTEPFAILFILQLF